MILVWVLVFLLGLAVGSFLNVVVYRLLHGESPFRGRSKCPHCGKKIAWYDNAPLISFVLLRGRCRHCQRKISWQYPVLELLTGLLFVWWYSVGRFFFRLTQTPYKTIQPVFWLIVGLELASLAVADGFYGVLPDVFTLSLAAIAFLYRLALTVAGIMRPIDFLLLLASGAGAALFFAGLVWVTRGKGMGWGDVKLALALGLVLGWPKIVVAMIVAFLTGASMGIILILRRKKRFGQTIPFGPFMVGGTVVALLWGEQLWGQYLRILGI